MPKKPIDPRTAILADAAALTGRAEAAHAAAVRWSDFDPAVLASALREAWPRIASPDDRRHLLKELFLGRHPRALEILDLGMGDLDPKVRSWAAEYLAGVAFRDFRRDPEGYARWRSVHSGMPLETALSENARMFVERLRQTVPSERRECSRELFEAVRTVNLAALADAGLPALLESWVSSGNAEVAENALRVLHRLPGDSSTRETLLASWIVGADPALARLVLRHVPAFGLADAFLQRHVAPLTRDRNPLRATALRAFGRKGAAWALEIVLPHVSDPDDDVFLAAAESLAEIGDPRAIPAMVAALAADPTASRLYGLGRFGLAPLAGVEFDASHDAKWWTAWLKRRGKKAVGGGKRAKATRPAVARKKPAKKKPRR